MFRWLKSYFIPHKHNNHKPHLLCSKSTTFILGIFLAVESLFLLSVMFFIPNSDFFAAIIPKVLISSANESRREYGEQQLSISPALVKAAQLKANDMASKSYFAHISPEGVTPWHWLSKIGYKYTLAGENLAVNFIDSQDVHNAWMNSPSHRSNILNKTFTEIGIATAQGEYQGRNAIFVVQYFGRPAPGTVQSPTRTGISSNDVSHASVSAEAGQVSASKVAGETDKHSPDQPLLMSILSQPRKIVTDIFMVMTFAVIFVLGMLIITKVEKGHIVPVLNGSLILIVALSLVLANEFVSLSQIAIL